MNNLKRSAILMAILLIVSKLLGIVREICMAKQFGTSYIVDAYAICTTFPMVLFTLFAKGFSESYIPIHVRTKQENRDALFNNTLSLLVLGSILLSGLSFLLNRQIVLLLAPGFDARSAELARFFIRIVVFQLPFYAAFALYSARISAEEDFVVQNFCDFIIVNVILIISTLIATPDAPAPLAYGYVISMLAAVAVLAVYARKKYQIHYHPVVQPKDPSFRSLCMLAIPLGISLLVNQLNAVVDRMFSSSLGEGITSALGYADKLQSILLTLTTTIFLQVCYPRMNRYFAAGEKEQGMSYARKAALIACYTSIPLTVLFAVYAKPIVRFIFQRGSFDTTSTVYTATCLRLYALGILFFAIRTILTNVLAANTRQHLILKNTVITVACNIALNFVLVHVMGYAGLALATSLSGLLACILMLIDTRKLQLHLFERSQGRDILLICIGTAAALGVSLPVFPRLLERIGSNGAIFLTTALSGLVYVIVTVMLKPGILVWMYGHLPAKLQIWKSYNQKIGENRNE